MPGDPARRFFYPLKEQTYISASIVRGPLTEAVFRAVTHYRPGKRRSVTRGIGTEKRAAIVLHLSRIGPEDGWIAIPTSL